MKVKMAQLPGKIVRRIRRDLREFGFGEFDAKYKAFGAPGNHAALKARWLMMLLFEHGVSVEDFFCYHLYEKPRREREKFVSLGRSRAIIRRMNRHCRRELVEDKALFGKAFAKYLKRRSISSVGLRFEDFAAFYRAEGRIIVKPAFGCNGNGIYIIERGEGSAALRRHYERISRQPYVLETVLEQDGLLKELNPKTLNTVRVNVLRRPGKMRVVNAILRSGQGDTVTDNICSGGCVTEIDVETGAFVSKLVDLSNHAYDRHPLTGVTLLGKTMPQWEAVKRVALEATELLPGAGYASWDIAVIKGNEIAIVEGNTYGNFNIQQVPRQRGVWPEYRAFMEETEK